MPKTEFFPRSVPEYGCQSLKILAIQSPEGTLPTTLFENSRLCNYCWRIHGVAARETSLEYGKRSPGSSASQGSSFAGQHVGWTCSRPTDQPMRVRTGSADRC